MVRVSIMPPSAHEDAIVFTLAAASGMPLLYLPVTTCALGVVRVGAERQAAITIANRCKRVPLRANVVLSCACNCVSVPRPGRSLILVLSPPQLFFLRSGTSELRFACILTPRGSLAQPVLRVFAPSTPAASASPATLTSMSEQAFRFGGEHAEDGRRAEGAVHGGAAAKIEVVFAPTEQGPAEVRVAITTNGGNGAVVVGAVGEDYRIHAPAAIDLGDVAAGLEANGQVEVTNLSALETPLTIRLERPGGGEAIGWRADASMVLPGHRSGGSGGDSGDGGDGGEGGAPTREFHFWYEAPVPLLDDGTPSTLALDNLLEVNGGASTAVAHLTADDGTLLASVNLSVCSVLVRDLWCLVRPHDMGWPVIALRRLPVCGLVDAIPLPPSFF